MAEKMSFNPSRILGIERGDISVGNVADIVVFDPKEIWTVRPEEFKSMGRNTPFAGKKLTGRVKAVLHQGVITKQ